MVKQVLQKLDTILNEPTESSAAFLEMALQAMEDGNPVRAKDHFMDATRKAVTGKLQIFSYYHIYFDNIVQSLNLFMRFIFI